MPIAVVEKYRLNKDFKKQVIHVKRHLTEAERSLLVDFFILGTSLIAEDRKQILTLCRSIREQDYWLQCDCTQDLSKPVFRFNRASSGKIYLHHITSRGKHSDACAFKEKKWKAQDIDSKPSPNIKKSTSLNLVFKKSDDARKLGNTEDFKEGLVSISDRYSSLNRALYRLIDDAKLNVINLEKKISPNKALDIAANEIDIVADKKLKNYLFINPSMIFKAVFLLRNDKSFWPKHISKHALLLVKARAFNEHAIEAILPDGSLKTIPISQRVYKSSGRLGVRSEPYMALILITDSVEKPRFYEPCKAFVVPCYSEKTFIPVDSYYEREILRRLFALQFEYQKRGVNLEITKPLFDIPIEKNPEEQAYVLPDFILQTPTKRLVIEVNGSHEEEYLARKARQHALMQSIGQVLSVDALGAEKEKRLASVINQFIFQIKTILDKK